MRAASRSEKWHSPASSNPRKRAEPGAATGHTEMSAPILAALVALCGLLLTSPTHACGVSASGVASCSLSEHEEQVRPHWAVGLSGLYTSTRLRFSDSLHADQQRYAVSAALAYLPTSKLVLQLSLGAAVAGRLVVDGQAYEFSPGPLAALGADYRIFESEYVFGLLTSSFSFSAAQTQGGDDSPEGYQAFDLRLGGALGFKLGRVFRPYALARVFGGPVFWRYQGRATTGTDTHHYQLGAGLALGLSRWSAALEGVPLGERALALTLGASF